MNERIVVHFYEGETMMLDAYSFEVGPDGRLVIHDNHRITMVIAPGIWTMVEYEKDGDPEGMGEGRRERDG